jgi:hypothetical protein
MYLICLLFIALFQSLHDFIELQSSYRFKLSRDWDGYSALELKSGLNVIFCMKNFRRKWVLAMGGLGSSSYIVGTS